MTIVGEYQKFRLTVACSGDANASSWRFFLAQADSEGFTSPKLLSNRLFLFLFQIV